MGPVVEPWDDRRVGEDNMSRHGHSKNLASVIPDDLREIRDQGTNERDFQGQTDGHCRAVLDLRCAASGM